MLALTRKLNQSITFGNPLGSETAIEIVVFEVRGDQVRLGAVAPRETSVHRHPHFCFSILISSCSVFGLITPCHNYLSSFLKRAGRVKNTSGPTRCQSSPCCWASSSAHLATVLF